MTTVIIDKDLREKLQDLEHEVKFCDESGRTVGRYLPEAEYTKLLYERARNMFSDEELEKAAREPGGISTAQLLARLEQL